MSVAINSSPAGALNSQSSWKRRGSDDEDDRDGDNVKKAKYSWYVTLESESPVPTDEDEESIYTVQGNETEFARDTSDTSTTWISSSKSDVSIQVEYELDSRSESDNPFMDLSSSSEPENILAVEFITFCDSEGLADDSDASRSSTDSDIKRADFRICIQCKNPNSNPLFRYCEKCYQVRKMHFPRTKPKRKARGQKERVVRTSSLTTSSVTSGQELCEMDSGLASSQDLERMTSDSMRSETPIFDSQSSDLTQVSGTSGTSSLGRESSRSTTRFIVDASLDRDEVDSSFAPKGCSSVYSPITQSSSSSTSGLYSTKDKTDESRDEPGSSNNSTTFGNTSISVCELRKKPTSDKEEHGNVTDSIPKSETESDQQSQGSDSLCRICVINPKNSVFVHGNTGHIYCCYGCARKVWTTNDRRCPICNRKVTQIIKAFTD